jgi:hypothetical protein
MKARKPEGIMKVKGQEGRMEKGRGDRRGEYRNKKNLKDRKDHKMNRIRKTKEH